MNNVEKIQPTGIFTNYIYKAIPLAFDESMSYYETLLGLLNYLKNTVIPTVNNNADAVIELQNLYTQLHDYVEHYFDNLDVQQEINNKLDTMAEDGTLSDLINVYIEPYTQELTNQFNNYKTQVNNEINNIESKVNGVITGAPIPVSNISDMTDTTRVYVLTTSGHWYYYDGDSWEDGGVYQSSVNTNDVDTLIDEVASLSSANYNYADPDDIIYESGGVDSSGNNYSSSKRIRTKAFRIYAEKGSKFTLLNNAYKYKIDKWTSSARIGTTDFLTTDYVLEQDCFIRFDIARVDGADIDIEDATDVLNVALVITTKDNLLENLISIDNLNFEQGGITAGIATTSSNTIRSPEFIKINNNYKIICAQTGGYNAYMYIYSSNNEESYTDTAIALTPNVNTNVMYKFTNECYIKLRVQKSDYSTFTPEDMASGTFKIERINNYDVNQKIGEFEKTTEFLYYPSSWSNKVQTVQDSQKKNFIFAVQTDVHMATHSATDNNDNTFNPSSASKENIYPLTNMTKEIGFDFIANLGDLVRGYYVDTTTNMKADLTEIIHRYYDGVECPLLVTIGNHDDNVSYANYSGTGMPSIIKPDEQYSRVIKPCINTTSRNLKQNGKSLYYYMDFENVRVIMLNTRDLEYEEISSSDIGINHHRISPEQVNWFTNTALNTNKAVMVMCHVPLVDALLPDANACENASSIISALQQFKTNQGVVIGCFYGHNHLQSNEVVDGINHISFKNGGNFAEVVIVDLTNKTIVTKMVGNYGGLQNRTFTF